MALVGNFLPKPTMLPTHFFISKFQKPKTMIVCAKPRRPPTGGGRGGQINSTVRLSTNTTVGVLKKVNPNSHSQLDVGEDNNQKSTKPNYNAEEASAAVKGAEPTD